MQELSRLRQYPTSCRLIDNEQFKFGATLKPAPSSSWEHFVEAAKKFFVINVKGFDPNKMTVCTLLFEGDKKDMTSQHKQALDIAKKYKGMAGGPENGQRGYLLTFLIAYSRDLAMQHKVAAESFETSVSWKNTAKLCERVKQRIYDEAAKIGMGPEKVWTSFRITQLYETGCAVYVYFTLYYHGFPREKVVHMYDQVEDAARDEVLKCGGSISHHHGIGKIRKGFVHRTLPQMAIEWQKSIKDSIDPKNIFGINNTVPRSDEEWQKVQKRF